MSYLYILMHLYSTLAPAMYLTLCCVLELATTVSENLACAS